MNAEDIFVLPIASLYGETQREKTLCSRFIEYLYVKYEHINPRKGVDSRSQLKKLHKELYDQAQVMRVSLVRTLVGDLPEVRFHSTASGCYRFALPEGPLSDFMHRLREKGMRASDWPLVAQNPSNICSGALAQCCDDVEDFLDLPLVFTRPPYSVFVLFTTMLVDKQIVANDISILKVTMREVTSIDLYELFQKPLDMFTRKASVKDLTRGFCRNLLSRGLEPKHGPLLQSYCMMYKE